MAVKATGKSGRAAAKKTVPARKSAATSGKGKVGTRSKPAKSPRGKSSTPSAATRKPARAKAPERRTPARDLAWKQLDSLRNALVKSGKTLTHWVDLLDKVGGPELGHGTLARILTATQHLDNWTANCLALHYRGLYGFGENAGLMDHQDRLDQLGEWK